MVFLLPVLLFGQKENDIWLFGLGAGLDFSSGTPVKIEDALMFSKEGCAVMSDRYGQLLFYTNGLKVWNRSHQVMSNGNGLNGGAETSSTNQAIIVPHPSVSSLYFIFTTDERAGANGLNYSMVDMTLNNGLGDVTQKNVSLYAPTTERLALARQADGNSFWLVTHGWENNEFITYEINENGLNDAPIISAIGASHKQRNTSNLNSRGYIAFNSNYTKMAIAVYKDNLIEVFDFDNCTGQIGNVITTDEILLPYGIAFSPNDQWIYATNLDGELYQLDANATTNNELGNSANLVGSTAQDHLSAIQQGPDGKLYVAIPNANELGVINSPDLEGIACDYQDMAIDLGIGISGEGLPQQLPFSEVNANPNRYLNATILATDGCENEPLQLSIDTDEEINQIQWIFNQNDTDNELTPTVLFSDTGLVNIQAIISNECKLDTLYDEIHIRQCDFPLFVPNAFTPNDDGDNDQFFVQGALDEIQSYEMVVFSRWGDTVFRSTNPTDQWNGRFRGKTVGDGVYVWIIKVQFFGMSEPRIISGDVTLFR